MSMCQLRLDAGIGDKVSMCVQTRHSAWGRHTLLEEENQRAGARRLDATLHASVREHETGEHEEPRHPSEAPAQDVHTANTPAQRALLLQVAEHYVDRGGEAYRIEPEKSLPKPQHVT